jgi:ABC-type uncharacterized transport system permease subunit
MKSNFFRDLISDNNNINEKSVVGFLAFLMMVVTLAVDVYTGMRGQTMPINEFVFDGFLVMALGSFGIASVDKFINAKREKEANAEQTPENPEI